MSFPKEPVRHTCPDINSAQDVLKTIVNNFSSLNENNDIFDILDIISDVSYDLNGLIDTFEELRNSNASLRDWGNEIQNIAEQLFSQKDQEIEELYEQIESQKEEIRDLENQLI